MKSVNFDWIGFTFNVDVPLDHVLDVFLGDLVLNEVGHGRLGYRNMMTDPDACVFLLYNGNDNMGVHLDFPATGVAVFFDCVVEYERWRRGAERDLIDVSDMTRSANLYHALSFMLEFGHFTRLDVAMDDEEDPAFTPAELDRYWDAGQIVTYCRSHKFVKTEGGDTFYLGSRQSCIMLRVYDKGAQMKAGRPWIRWEFEIKSPEYTGLFIQRFGECESLSVLFISYLDRFMRIVSPDGAARPVDRRPLRKWLISIIGSIITS